MTREPKLQVSVVSFPLELRNTLEDGGRFLEDREVKDTKSAWSRNQLSKAHGESQILKWQSQCLCRPALGPQHICYGCWIGVLGICLTVELRVSMTLLSALETFFLLLSGFT